MDNKRLLLATAICFVILMGWQALARYMGWVPEPTEVAPVAVEDTARPESLPLPQEPVADTPRFAPSAGREIVVETPLYSAVFHSGGGVLQSFTLKHYDDSVGPEAQPLAMVDARAATVSPMGLLINGQPTWNMGEWSFAGEALALDAGQSGTLEFKGLLNGLHITRTITFHADSYLMDENLTLASNAPMVGSIIPTYTVATGNLGGSSNSDIMSMAWDDAGSLKKEQSEKDLLREGVMKSGDLYWAGVMSNYFLAAVLPGQTENAVFKGRITENGVWRAGLDLAPVSLTQGTDTVLPLKWWIGPKDAEMLKTAPNQLADAVDMGFFAILAMPLLWLLRFFQSLVTNWGVAIILLTVVIKILFWPLTKKTYSSMEKMKQLQPMMAQLQEKYGKDKEALTRETMQLYKTYGVNPMGGCLPMLVQLPVFIALYQALLHAIELRHASFITYLPFTDKLWLADLSVKDPYFITPLIMGGTMFLQQWLSPAVADPTQKRIMMLMPVVFTVMFLQFPSGLVLYWLCNNVLSIAQQWWTLRKV